MPALKRRKSRIKHVVPIRTLEDSPSTLDRSLLSAYLKTAYRLPTLGLTIRVNQPCPALWTLLPGSSLAIVTAWNPGSRMLPGAENRQRNEALTKALPPHAVAILPALGEGDAGDWPPEESLGIAGVSLEEAARLAALFEQNAFVFVEKDQAAVLVWVR